MGAMEIMLKSFGINPEEIQKAAGFAQEKLANLDAKLDAIHGTQLEILRRLEAMHPQKPYLVTADGNGKQ